MLSCQLRQEAQKFYQKREELTRQFFQENLSKWEERMHKAASHGAYLIKINLNYDYSLDGSLLFNLITDWSKSQGLIFSSEPAPSQNKEGWQLTFSWPLSNKDI